MQSPIDVTDQWPLEATWGKLTKYDIQKEDVMSKINQMDDDRKHDTIINIIYEKLEEYQHTNSKEGSEEEEEGSDNVYVDTILLPIMLELYSTFPGALAVLASRHSYGTVSTDSGIWKQHNALAMGSYKLGEERLILTLPDFVIGKNLSAGSIRGVGRGGESKKRSDEMFFDHVCKNLQTITSSCVGKEVILLYVDMLRLNRDMEVLKERFSKLEGVGATVRFMRQFMDSNEMLSLLDTLIKNQRDLEDKALGNHIDAAADLRGGLHEDVRGVQKAINRATNATRREMKKVGTSARAWLVDGADKGEELKKIMLPIIEEERDYITSTLINIRDAQTQNEVRTIASDFVTALRSRHPRALKSAEKRVGCSLNRMTDTDTRDTIELNNCKYSVHQNSMAKAYFEELEKVDKDFTAPSSVAVISATHKRQIVSFDELRDSYIMTCTSVALGQLSDLVTTLTPRLSCIENLVEFVLCLCEVTRTEYHQSWGYKIDPRVVAKVEAKRVEENEKSLTKTINKVEISGELAEELRVIASWRKDHTKPAAEKDSEEEAPPTKNKKKAAKNKTKSKKYDDDLDDMNSESEEEPSPKKRATKKKGPAKKKASRRDDSDDDPNNEYEGWFLKPSHSRTARSTTKKPKYNYDDSDVEENSDSEEEETPAPKARGKKKEMKISSKATKKKAPAKKKASRSGDKKEEAGGGKKKKASSKSNNNNKRKEKSKKTINDDDSSDEEVVVAKKKARTSLR